MQTRMRQWLAAAAIAAILSGCASTTEQDTGSKTKVADNLEAHEKRIQTVVDSLEFARGSRLLRDLQWLIKQKQLAEPSVIAALETASDRTRANLLYVLGFQRTKVAHDALVAFLQDPDDAIRYEAAAGLLQHGDSSAIPVLMTFLEDADKHVRYKAIEALREGTGADFGYAFAAPAEKRAAAVARWQAWWDKEKDRLMRRPRFRPAPAERPVSTGSEAASR